MNNEELNRYSIEWFGDYAVIYLNNEQMVSFDSKEEFISKFREVYNLTEKDKMEQHITEDSKDITEYFSNKSDSEIHKLLLLNLETDGLDLDESIEAEVEFTEDEYSDLFWACTNSVWLLLDYQGHIVYSGNGEKEVVNELTKKFTYDCEHMQTTEYDLSDTLVNKFLDTEEAEIYNKHVSEHERTKDEQYWLKAQYYVYLAGLRLARKVVSVDIFK